LPLKNSYVEFKSRTPETTFETQKLPEKKKEAKSCHECGLEDINTCEFEFTHRSSRPSQTPCVFCLRNPEKVGWYDFYHEQWTLNTRDDAILEDPTPSDVSMLQVLRDIVQKEYEKLPLVRR
jgi:hypothetical protein